MTPLKVQKVLADFGGRWFATGLGALGVAMTAGLVPVEILVRIVRSQLEHDHDAAASTVPNYTAEV